MYIYTYIYIYIYVFGYLSFAGGGPNSRGLEFFSAHIITLCGYSMYIICLYNLGYYLIRLVVIHVCVNLLQTKKTDKQHTQ